VKEEPAGRRPAERRTERPVEKVAPWKRWRRLPLVASASGTYPVTFTVSDPELDPEQNARYSKLITSAARKHFGIEKPPREGEEPAAYLVGAGRLRVVYKELLVQFGPQVPGARRSAILKETDFEVVGESPFAKDQWIVRHADGLAGESLLTVTDAFARFDEVEFAWPNSVAEYVRASDGIPPKTRRWWLDKIKVNYSTGRRRVIKGDSNIFVGVIDDGVDISHPNLSSRVASDPGRDFALLPSDPGHLDPRPKRRDPDDDDSSDYHGTLCAGVICSDGNKKEFFGVAPGCTMVAIRAFDGSDLIVEARLAAAIRYATSVAHVISCSWMGEEHADVVKALDDTALGRGGKGTVVVCSAGNDVPDVAFPARHSLAIAVGACGPNYQVTPYSAIGDAVDVVTPSSMDDSNVYSTDVATEGWGFNSGEEDDGLFWPEFGRTSAAAAIAAGVAALCLSVNPNLTAAELCNVLVETADQVGDPNDVIYDPQTGHSQEFGYGCINAKKAVKTAKEMLTSVAPA
jgi:subtilisin family serine protease